MNKTEFYDYIISNFELSGESKRLISNILDYVEAYSTSQNESYYMLCELLDSTIGISHEEIKKACLYNNQ